jgi:hypothetical protein
VYVASRDPQQVVRLAEQPLRVSDLRHLGQTPLERLDRRGVLLLHHDAHDHFKPEPDRLRIDHRPIASDHPRALQLPQTPVTRRGGQLHPLRQLGDRQSSLPLQLGKDLSINFIHATDSYSITRERGQIENHRTPSETYSVSMLDKILGLTPIAAGISAIPQFIPQLRVVRSGRPIDGVSGTWAALTSINNTAWTVYFALSRYWTATVSAAIVMVIAGILAVELTRRGRMSSAGTQLTSAWSVLLVVLGIGFGRVALGTALTAAFVMQVSPSLYTAYRTRHPTGISRGTWLLILGELICYGLYGLKTGDPRLITLGSIGTTASLLMLARAGQTTLEAPIAATSAATLG